MEYIGWLLSLIAALYVTFITFGVIVVSGGLGGKVGKEWILPAIVTCVCWYAVIWHAPFTISFNS